MRSRFQSLEVITERAVRDALRAMRSGRYLAAFGYLELAIEADPLCREALVLAGDVCYFQFDDLGITEAEGADSAVGYYDRAIAACPHHAEAYAEKSLCLHDRERYQEALECAELGFSYLEVPPTKDLEPDVWVNVAESLYRRKALALKELGRVEDGWRVLLEGLSRFPESTYLTQCAEQLPPP
jgi:tetratricopeptide (TPR) repeat protein